MSGFPTREQLLFVYLFPAKKSSMIVSTSFRNYKSHFLGKEYEWVESNKKKWDADNLTF